MKRINYLGNVIAVFGMAACSSGQFQVKPTSKFSLQSLREKKIMVAVGVAPDRNSSPQCIEPLSPTEMEASFYQVISGDTFHVPAKEWSFDPSRVPLEAELRKDMGFGNYVNHDAALKMVKEKGYYGVLIGMVVVGACRDSVDTFTGWGNQDKIQVSSLWTLQSPEGEEIWSASIHFKDGFNGLDARHIRSGLQQLAIKVTRAVFNGRDEK